MIGEKKKTEYNDVKGMKKRAKVRRSNSCERFIYAREKLALDSLSLIYLEPVERFLNRSNVMKSHNTYNC